MLRQCFIATLVACACHGGMVEPPFWQVLKKTARATGCFNPYTIELKTMWLGLDRNQVLNAMFDLCRQNEIGNATLRETSLCCGDDTPAGMCRPSCTKQQDFATIVSPETLMATYQATGCTNQDKSASWWSWQPDEIVFQDMYGRCNLKQWLKGCCGEDATIATCQPLCTRQTQFSHVPAIGTTTGIATSTTTSGTTATGTTSVPTTGITTSTTTSGTTTTSTTVPPPSWSHSTSDGHPPADCYPGLVSGIRCSGRYCDDMSLFCDYAVSTTDVGTFGAGFSDENGPYVCPEGQVVTGLACSGDYCDDVYLKCSSVSVELKDCVWKNPVSEEGGGTLQFGEGIYLKGMQCDGSYCDDVSAYVCAADVYVCETESCQTQLATRHAPLLRFDSTQDDFCFPSDASEYYHRRTVEEFTGRICNTDYNSIQSNEIPIYFQYQECSSNPDVAVIKYWFFYGYQKPCFEDEGSHDGDWESIAVALYRGKLQRVMYVQHSQNYTKNDGEFELHQDTHPVSYVGRIAHGDYHDDGGSYTPGLSCLPFNDARNPMPADKQMQTWNNLVRLRDDADAPVWMRSTTQFPQSPSSPLQRHEDLCYSKGCHGHDFAPTDAGCMEPGCANGCMKSSVPDTDFFAPYLAGRRLDGRKSSTESILV